MYDAIEKQRILQGYNGVTSNTYNSRHTNLSLSENNFKTIRPDQAKECNYYSTVLYFLSALRVINGTCCCTVVGARTEAEFMNVQFC